MMEEELEHQPEKRQTPYETQDAPSPPAPQRHQAHRRIGARDQYENRHMIEALENILPARRERLPVIDGAGGAEQVEARDIDREAHDPPSIAPRLHAQRDQPGDRQPHPEEARVAPRRRFGPPAHRSPPT